MQEREHPRVKGPTRIVLAVSLAMGTLTGASVVGKAAENTQLLRNSGISEANSYMLPTPESAKPASPIIEDYAKAVEEDMQKLRENFSSAGLTDLSGHGFDACVVDPDCLGGTQKCVAGTKPNTPSMPGYCVPEDTNK